MRREQPDRRRTCPTVLPALLILLFPTTVLAFDGDDLAQIGLAYAATVAIHESGHAIVGDQLGARRTKIRFFTRNQGKLFLGYSSYDSLPAQSRLPYLMGGQIMNSVGFDLALESYRRKPTTFNSALLLFLGTDFLWYSLSSLYLTTGHPGQDPVAIHRETGLSKEAIISVAALSTLVNAHRVVSERDTIVPSFTFNEHSVMFNLTVPF